MFLVLWPRYAGLDKLISWCQCIIIPFPNPIFIWEQVTLKIRWLPEASAFGSIVFPTFSDGVACLREVICACICNVVIVSWCYITVGIVAGIPRIDSADGQRAVPVWPRPQARSGVIPALFYRQHQDLLCHQGMSRFVGEIFSSCSRGSRGVCVVVVVVVA